MDWSEGRRLVGTFRNFLYVLARILGDVQAVRKGRVGRRITRRVAGRATGKVFRRIFR